MQQRTSSSRRLCLGSMRDASISPRAQGVLFTFSRPKGLKVVSSVEISADFENPFLKKICVERFSEIELKVGYPHFELWPFCKSEN